MIEADGADTLAKLWAESRGIPVDPYPADWDGRGRGAGMRRNRKMLRLGKPDLVIAFPGEKGTADMVRLARRAGIPLVEIAQSGDVEAFPGNHEKTVASWVVPAHFGAGRDNPDRR